MSWSEVQQNLLAAAQSAEEMAGQIGGAANTCDTIQQHVNAAFEGGGPAEALELSGIVQSLAIELSDKLVEAMRIQTLATELANRLG